MKKEYIQQLDKERRKTFIQRKQAIENPKFIGTNLWKKISDRDRKKEKKRYNKKELEGMN